MNEKTARELLQKVKDGYTEIASSFHKTRKHAWPEFVIFKNFIKNNDTLADLGCGNGRLLKFLKDDKIKVKYIGIDNNIALLDKARNDHPKSNFIEGDLLKLPLEDQSIDCAASVASIHHIPSKKLRYQAVEELHRILKKDGTLLLTAWNLFQPKYKKYITMARLRSIITLGKYDPRDTFIPWSKSGIKRYYYAFKMPELKKLLANHFEIIESHTGHNFTLICKKKKS